MSTVEKKKDNSKKINAPFGYFGSKNKIALQLCGELPPHNCWVEAFCGSAALTLRKTPALIEVINDIDNEVVNFFEQLRDNSNALIKAVELTPYAEQELISSRMASKEIDKLERARRFLVQSMMAINGVFGEAKSGFSYSDSYSRSGIEARVNRWNNLPDRLKLVVQRLKAVRIERKDAIKLIERYINRPATLLYLDPPYLGDRASGYNRDANNDDFHVKLLNLANEAKSMIFISGYENDLYNSILTKKRGWETRTIETFTKDVKGRIHNRTEVVWMNRHFRNTLQTNKIPIDLTEKEQKQNKVNPERL
jgi:DNA adenine methylase